MEIATPYSSNHPAKNQSGFPNLRVGYDAWFIQLVNSEVILASECTRTVEGTYRLIKPIRLLVQQAANGGVAIGFAPMIHFISKDAQNFKTLDINASQVMFKVRLSEVLKDGERLAKGYHEEVSGIALT